jgi:SulP family sulfate permease
LQKQAVPFVDVTAARMLVGLSEELDREHVRFVVARDVGQVRDVLRHVGDGEAPLPSVSDAVEAVTGSRSRPGA